MSETTPQAEGAPPPEPAAPATEAPAPAADGAATDDTKTDEPEPKPSRTERRIAALSARLSAGEQERERLAAEVEQYRRHFAPAPAEPQFTPEQQAAVDRLVEAKMAQRTEAERSESFHTAGRAAYPADWSERCTSLMQMGADAQFAQLLIETPDGAKVAGALADDPEELERITGLRTERARAIALGKFAATLESKPAAARTSRAPAPIRPINGASARVEVNEQTMTTQQLVDLYSKQAMAKRGL